MAATSVGIMIEGQEGLNWERWRRLCRLADELGFDSLWRSDHYTSVLGVEGRDCIETWVSLALAAEWTKRVEFGPLVSSMTFRQPELVARMAASVDQLSGGRLVLGLGAGWYEEEHRRFNVPFPSVNERMDGLEDGLRRIRETWNVALPAPKRDPLPILIGGAGENRVLRIVAREASEWNCHGFDPEAYRAKAGVLAERCREIGRDPSTIRRSYMSSYLVGRNAAELRGRAEALREFIPRYREASPDDVIAQTRERGWFVGSPDELVDQMRPYVDAGVQRFMLQHFLMDDDDALRVLSERVIPALGTA